ncbi:NAD+ diphosphatase [Butyrivibrio proteoclasticus]|uniref:NAD(+) diphosphatase n=1 Tax=Butyrivibrio proteoclasticus TaxID=43305 RepID=A0A1I5R0V5_9FIRM|nr:NAD(+) diphosphatase [Butyrivibrio proteoclasticus]SFP51696.1 NAD+ diphosphatase [Butyrivibrio proteoclasticus]
MLQDIKPLELKNHYDPTIKPANDDIVIAFTCSDKGKELLINFDENTKKITYPTVSEIQYYLVDHSVDEALIYIFSIGKERFFLLRPEIADNAFEKNADEKNAYKNLPANFGFELMAIFRREYFNPQHYVYAAYTAFQLHEWYQVTRFCGKCGALNENHKTERARICPKCGNVIYPRINPAVIIGVTDKETNKMILTKYRTGFAHNALVAGFTEIGETLEETVKREVMEEVGLEVTNIRYYKSQPWGIVSDILAGFFCDVTGKKDITMDQSELKYAEWVSPEDVQLQPLEYSLTNEMMKLFKEKGYMGTL